MKTHPGSIFTRVFDVDELNDGGTGDLWSSRELLPEYSITEEFVPAAACIELKTRLEKRESQLSQAITCAGKAIGEVIGLKSQLQTQTENMLKLREFVGMIANVSHFEELPGDLICQAQDLIGTLK